MRELNGRRQESLQDIRSSVRKDKNYIGEYVAIFAVFITLCFVIARLLDVL